MKKRLILILLYDGCNFFISRNFKLQMVGNLDWLFKNFNLTENSCGIDEIVIIYVSDNEKNYNVFLNNIRLIKRSIFLPLTVGGKINSLDKVDNAINFGADKILVSTSIYEDVTFVESISKIYGKQFITVAIDYKKEKDKFFCYDMRPVEVRRNSMGALINLLRKIDVGEILFTSIERDGTGRGFDEEFIDYLAQFDLPQSILVAGGAGKITDYYNAMLHVHIEGACTSNLFYFMDSGFIKVKKFLMNKEIDVNMWNFSNMENIRGSMLVPSEFRKIETKL